MLDYSLRATAQNMFTPEILIVTLQILMFNLIQQQRKSYCEAVVAAVN